MKSIGMLNRILLLSAALAIAAAPIGALAQEAVDTTAPEATMQTNRGRPVQAGREAAKTAAQNRRELLKQIEEERKAALKAAESKRAELKAANESRRVELQKALADKRAETRQTIETKRERIRKELSDKREETKQAIQEKRGELKTETDKRKAELVGRYFDKASQVLSARVKKLTVSADAIEERIAVLEERGANLESARTRLAEARARLDAAEAAIAELDAAALAAATPETREGAVAKLKAFRLEAEEAVKNAHAALADVISRIRFGLSKINTQRSATGTAATSSVAQ